MDTALSGVMMDMNAPAALPTLLCCICGVEIEHNPCNMCVSCLKDKVDITEDINKSLTIHSCRNCGRWLCPPWQELQLESKELMATCLRKISGLSKVKLIDAVWVWTEPHSLRLKIKLTIQKEVMNGAVLQQATIVEFTIRNQQCVRCQANFATGAWHAVVQVRQRVPHKRTFFFLEQLLLKYNAHADCINIVTFRDGMDFYFIDKQQGIKFVDFLAHHVPTKHKYARKLVSASFTDNTANFKHNHLVTIVPLCKDDLLILPKSLASQLSNISRMVLVRSVAAEVHIFDPLTCEKQEIVAEKYWRDEFESVMTSRQLIRFVVLGVETIAMNTAGVAPSGINRNVNSNNLRDTNPSAAGNLNQNHKRGAPESVMSFGTVMSRNYNDGPRKRRAVGEASAAFQQVYRPSSKQRGGHDKKMRLVEVTVAREKDLGVNDTQFTVITHLGNILKEGDVVLGYDLVTAHWTQPGELEDRFGQNHKQNIPDVVLVRKQFPTKGERKWLLKQMDLDERYSRGPGEGPAVEKERERAEKAAKRGGGTNKDRAEEDLAQEEYEEFMEEIAHDRDMRKHINLYKKPKQVGRFKGEKRGKTGLDLAAAAGQEGMQEEEEDQWEDVNDEDGDEDDVQLDELLDELVVSDRITEQLDALGSSLGAMAPQQQSVEEAEEEVKRGASAFVAPK